MTMAEVLMYSAKSAAVLCMLYVPYTLLLHRDSFFRQNRLVLLGILLLSLVLPLCNVPWLSMDRQPVMHAAQVQMVEIGIPVQMVVPAEAEPAVERKASFPLFSLLTAIYMTGVCAVLLFRLWQMGCLHMALRRGCLWRQTEDGITVRCHAGRVAPYSWMRNIVISEQDYNESGREIVLHETGHIRNGHSWDILLLTLVQMLQWWNPLAYMLGVSLRDLHEYEADDYVLRRGVSARAYQILLIKKAVGYGSYTFANNFNHSLTKKRITMMRRSKSNPWMRSKALYVVPVAALALSAFATPEIVSPAEGVLSEPESKGMENYLTGQAGGEENQQNAATMEILRSPVAGNRLPAEATYYVDGEKMERGIAVRRIVDGREVVLITRKGADGKETVTVVGSNKNNAVDEAKALLRQEGVQQLNVKKEGVNDNDSIYNVVSENAEFPGGNMAASIWISKNMTYPEECRKKGIEGRVVIKFVVNKDGSIVDAEAVKSPHPALAEEGLRVVKSMPKWKPAKEGGKVVRSRFNVPIMFRLDGKKTQYYTSPQKPQSPQSLTDEQKAVQDWYGTQPALMTHLMKNTRYPKECQEQGFQGKVVVSVNVDQDGAMSVKGGEYMPWSDKKDASVVVNTYKNADGTQAAKLSEEELQALLVKEAERVLKLAPKLKPYKNEKGETVSAAFKVPVMFRLN